MFECYLRFDGEILEVSEACANILNLARACVAKRQRVLSELWESGRIKTANIKTPTTEVGEEKHKEENAQKT